MRVRNAAQTPLACPFQNVTEWRKGLGINVPPHWAVCSKHQFAGRDPEIPQIPSSSLRRALFAKTASKWSAHFHRPPSKWFCLENAKSGPQEVPTLLHRSGSNPGQKHGNLSQNLFPRRFGWSVRSRCDDTSFRPLQEHISEVGFGGDWWLQLVRGHFWQSFLHTWGLFLLRLFERADELDEGQQTKLGKWVF